MLRKYKLQLRLQNLCSADMYKKSPKYTAQVVNTLQVQNYTKSCKTLAPKYTAVRTIKYCNMANTASTNQPIKTRKIAKKQYKVVQKNVAKCCENTNYSLGCKISAVQKCIKSCKTLAPKYTAVKTIKYYNMANTASAYSYNISSKISAKTIEKVAKSLHLNAQL